MVGKKVWLNHVPSFTGPTGFCHTHCRVPKVVYATRKFSWLLPMYTHVVGPSTIRQFCMLSVVVM